MMNRDAMLVALGVGVGALISTDQGRHILGTLAKTPIAQAIGESAMNLLNNTAIGGGNTAGAESAGNHNPQEQQTDSAAQGA